MKPGDLVRINREGAIYYSETSDLRGCYPYNEYPFIPEFQSMSRYQVEQVTGVFMRMVSIQNAEVFMFNRLVEISRFHITLEQEFVG